MKPHTRFEILGLAIFATILAILTISMQYTSASSQVPGPSCSITFSGNLASFQMSPEGSWRMTSSYCTVTGESAGVTSGTFTGLFDSGVFNGMVSGTWTMAGSTQKVVASSSTGFTISLSTDLGYDRTPVIGSAYQGVLSGNGNPGMFATGTTGQVALK